MSGISHVQLIQPARAYECDWALDPDSLTKSLKRGALCAINLIKEKNVENKKEE